MRSAPVSIGLTFLVAGAPLVGVACAKDRKPFEREPPSTSLVADDAGEPTSCEESILCSSDLKRVLRRRCDGGESVETECGPDLGCGDGACVDPCKSAELSKGSMGCSFATLPPDGVIDGSEGSCFAAMIANVWDRPVNIHATLGADPLDIGQSTYYAEMSGTSVEYRRVEGPVAPGKVALVFLSGSDGLIRCPDGVVPAFQGDPIAHGTARTRAFRLTTDAPVSAYSIYPYGGARSFVPTATLLLPISSWETKYIAVSTWAPPSNILGAPVVQIVAAEDGTEVRMRPNVNLIGGPGVAGISKGQTQTWTLDANEVLQIKQPVETSGSPIEASKPIGLFGGSDCVNIPLNQKACDLTQQQITAVSQWGSSYALVPYRPRNDSGTAMTTARESVPWRFVGAADGTKLTYDPRPPVGAPETLEAGQVVMFTTGELVTVRSQDDEHPFHAAMFMTGCQSVAASGSLLGDPDFVNAVPSGQFLDRYIFFVDHTYPDTTLTLVRRRTATGFHPVTLDCAGEITDWAPLGDDGEYEFAWVYLIKDYLPRPFSGGSCGPGRHEAHSLAPFSVHVWGMGPAASYGYAGGQGIRRLTTVQGPPVN